MQQVCVIDDNSKDKAQKLADEYLGGTLPSISSGSTKENPFGIKECLMCKLDGNSKTVLESSFADTNVPNKYFTNAESCLEYAEMEEDPTLLICGWWDTDLNAAAFLQRFRKSCPKTIIAVVYRRPDSAELALLEEINCALLIKPPVIKESILEKIVWAIQQDQRPLEKSFLLSKITQSLEENKVDQAIKYKEDLERNELANSGTYLLLQQKSC